MTAQADLFAHPVAEPDIAQALKDQGQARQTASPRLETLRESIARRLAALASTGGEFTSDDVYLLAETEGDPLRTGPRSGPCSRRRPRPGPSSASGGRGSRPSGRRATGAP